MSYYDDSAATTGAIVATLIFIGCLVVFIGISAYLFLDLMKKDKQLPQGQNCMNPGMILAYWLIFFCVGCLGNVVFYFLAKQEIQKRVVMQGGAGGVQDATHVQTKQAYPQQSYSGESPPTLAKA